MSVTLNIWGKIYYEILLTTTWEEHDKKKNIIFVNEERYYQILLTTTWEEHEKKKNIIFVNEERYYQILLTTTWEEHEKKKNIVWHIKIPFNIKWSFFEQMDLFACPIKCIQMFAFKIRKCDLEKMGLYNRWILKYFQKVFQLLSIIGII